MNKNEVALLWQEDFELMTILAIIESLKLKDCWLCAGSLRNYLWDHFSGNKPSLEAGDLDIIFFDPQIPYVENHLLTEKLKGIAPRYNWEVKNQVYMHLHNFADERPYQNSGEAIARFPETCTAVAAHLDKGKLELLAPYGFDDILNFTVRPTPYFQQDAKYLAIYADRVQKKNWSKKWPDLQIFYS